MSSPACQIHAQFGSVLPFNAIFSQHAHTISNLKKYRRCTGNIQKNDCCSFRSLSIFNLCRTSTVFFQLFPAHPTYTLIFLAYLHIKQHPFKLNSIMARSSKRNHNKKHNDGGGGQGRGGLVRTGLFQKVWEKQATWSHGGTQGRMRWYSFFGQVRWRAESP